MRMSREETARSRARIVRAASRLTRERGVDGLSVSEATSSAGLTHGGFYRHFASKEAMLVEALELAFTEMIGRLETGDLANFEANYLSERHRAQPGAGCPIAALGGEMARASPKTKQAFGRGVDGMIEALAAGLPGPSGGRPEAMRRLAMMVGAISIARVSQETTAREVLAACRFTESRG